MPARQGLGGRTLAHRPESPIRMPPVAKCSVPQAKGEGPTTTPGATARSASVAGRTRPSHPFRRAPGWRQLELPAIGPSATTVPAPAWASPMHRRGHERPQALSLLARRGIASPSKSGPPLSGGLGIALPTSKRAIREMSEARLAGRAGRKARALPLGAPEPTSGGCRRLPAGHPGAQGVRRAPGSRHGVPPWPPPRKQATSARRTQPRSRRPRRIPR